MMYTFLTRDNEDARVADTLAFMKGMSERVEMLSRQILRSVGTDEAKLTAELYDTMLSFDVVRDLSWMHYQPTPRIILENPDLKSCALALGLDIKIEETEDFSMSGTGMISKSRYEYDSEQYISLRNKLIEILQKHNVLPEDYIISIKDVEKIKSTIAE